MPPSILLIDADANFRRALRVALTLEGVLVGEGTTVDDARKALLGRRWDCVLVDLLLPSGDARRVVELVEQHRGTGLVACAAHSEVLAPLAGRAKLLEKPFSPAQLLRCAASFFNRVTGVENR